MTSHRLTFITPLFSKGSYDAQPEIRPPSIRGQLHWWFRALGGSHTDEKAIFGGVHGDPVSSKIVVRVSNISGRTGDVATLPHKQGSQASPKSAFLAGTTTELHLLERFGGLSETQRKSFRRAVEAWLLAGTLGLRSTRAGGSFIWEPITQNGISMPSDSATYAARLVEIFKGAPMKVMLLNEEFTSAESARRCVSDTLGGRDDPHGTSDLSRLNDPLGKIFNGRKTSPLRFRIVMLGNTFRIVAAWDNRSSVTGNQPNDLQGVIALLVKRGKEIGRAMEIMQ